ncbi:hypothetical protein AGABI1DRAFT_133313 [Agaricus bisporus var. burnettii JB137-S8]|uniref:Uncharacterized protein n=1 Tax=Agaricus bisporus var. burnettii (strain JB137-S8 / ATCC MYA-4627 / FGSC 10392) TaxID=597362 RepID=K5VJ54_AGABU|nr:uncharacterized protein AGABI1DRAFT_133313 [Agaricus bisporus var. burnettii JB137-S8]EKM74394.1 hypothetical protein AGABI1DRAFT_133313 [Agaricus bisporus var. burnettii JB137-S8]
MVTVAGQASFGVARDMNLLVGIYRFDDGLAESDVLVEHWTGAEDLRTVVARKEELRSIHSSRTSKHLCRWTVLSSRRVPGVWIQDSPVDAERGLRRLAEEIRLG